MNTKDKLLEWLRGERDWDQRAMARECLEALEQAYRDGVSDGFAAGKDAGVTSYINEFWKLGA